MHRLCDRSNFPLKEAVEAVAIEETEAMEEEQVDMNKSSSQEAVVVKKVISCLLFSFCILFSVYVGNSFLFKCSRSRHFEKYLFNFYVEMIMLNTVCIDGGR